MIFLHFRMSRLCICAGYALSSSFNGFIDFRVSGTTAEVPGEIFLHLLAGGMRMCLQQGNAGKQHTRCAVATLRCAQFSERFLQGMQLAVLLQALDGSDCAFLYF